LRAWGGNSTDLGSSAFGGVHLGFGSGGFSFGFSGGFSLGHLSSREIFFKLHFPTWPLARGANEKSEHR